jgi:hypothetical protein
MGPTRVDELLARAVEADVAERRALREALAAVAARLDACEARLGRLEAALAEGVAALRASLDALAAGEAPTVRPPGPVIDLAAAGGDQQPAGARGAG